MKKDDNHNHQDAGLNVLSDYYMTQGSKNVNKNAKNKPITTTAPVTSVVKTISTPQYSQAPSFTYAAGLNDNNKGIELTNLRSDNSNSSMNTQVYRSTSWKSISPITLAYTDEAINPLRTHPTDNAADATRTINASGDIPHLIEDSILSKLSLDQQKVVAPRAVIHNPEPPASKLASSSSEMSAQLSEGSEPIKLLRGRTGNEKAIYREREAAGGVDYTIYCLPSGNTPLAKELKFRDGLVYDIIDKNLEVGAKITIDFKPNSNEEIILDHQGNLVSYTAPQAGVESKLSSKWIEELQTKKAQAANITIGAIATGTDDLGSGTKVSSIPGSNNPQATTKSTPNKVTAGAMINTFKIKKSSSDAKTSMAKVTKRSPGLNINKLNKTNKKTASSIDSTPPQTKKTTQKLLSH